MPTLADVEKLRSAMQTLPEVQAEQRNMSNQDAVKALAADIAALRDKGYTWEAVAEFMTQHGFDIKPTTLKSYARRASSGQSKTKRARKPARQAAASVDAQPVQKTAQAPVQPAATPEAATKAPPAVQKPDKPKAAPADKKPSDADARFTAREDSDDI